MTEPKNGLLLYAKVLYELKKSPKSSAEMLPIMGLSRNANRALLGQMHLRGLLHIVDWQADHLGRTCMPVWAYGEGEDAPYPKRKTGQPGVPRKPAAQRRKANLAAFAQAIKAMEQPQTTRMLSEETGLCRRAVLKMVNYMHDKRLIHVADWDRESALEPVAMYAMGDRPNKARPKPKTAKELWPRKRDAMKAKAETLRIIRALAGVSVAA